MCQNLLKPSHQELLLVCMALIKAVRNGRVEFVTAVLNANYKLVWTREFGTENNIFMLAVVYRQNKVFQFLCGFLLKNTILSFVNNNGNNILHMAATLEPSARRNTVPGSAFLMQREVQWFKVTSLTSYHFGVLIFSSFSKKELFLVLSWSSN